MYRSKDWQLTTAHCGRACSQKGRFISWAKLRIDPNDGSPELEYRIENGRMEHRILKVPTQGDAEIEAQWQQLTPEELASHVLNSTILSDWLCFRMGVQSLLRASNQHHCQ